MGLLEHTGCKDIFLSLKELSLPFLLAKADIRQKYRRSSLGPFWITISTGVMIACIGLIFGGLFKSPTEDFLPFLTDGDPKFLYTSSQHFNFSYCPAFCAKRSRLEFVLSNSWLSNPHIKYFMGFLTIRGGLY